MAYKVTADIFKVSPGNVIIKESYPEVTTSPSVFSGIPTEDIPLTVIDFNDEHLYDDLCDPIMEIEFGMHDEMRTLTQQEKRILMNTLKREQKLLPKFEIKEVAFQVTSKEYIKKLTGDRVINRKYSKKIDVAQPGTINDPRLGVIKGQSICHTCLKNELSCPGHDGRIELYKPIINPLYWRDIIAILTCVCNTCGKLLLTKEQIDELPLSKVTNSKTRLKLLEAHLSEKRFKHEITRPELCFIEGIEIETGPTKLCHENPIYSKDRDDSKLGKIMYYTSSDKDKNNKKERTIEDIEKIFLQISSEDAELMGLGDTQPIDLIMYYILVLPPIRRGENIFEGTMDTDKMGGFYDKIVEFNEKLKDRSKYYESPVGRKKKRIAKEKTPKERIAHDEKTIYEYITQLLSSKETVSIRGQPVQSSIKKMMQGKTGQFRQYSMAKRVNFTARTVISPNPALEFGKIGIPRAFAPYLTVPVRVVDFNKDGLNRLLRDGKISYVLKDPDFSRLNPIRINKQNIDTIELEIGDEVWRHLRDGDYVTANRMPSLHRNSMLGLEVKLHPNLNIQLHLSYTTGFNADFDGDEMNIHVGQTIGAMVEIQELMNAKLCIPNDQNNSVLIGLVMDNVAAPALLTRDFVEVDIDTWNDCLMLITAKEDLASLDDRLHRQEIKKYTGKALFSALLPSTLNYKKKEVVIVEGILKSGIITKDDVGPTANNIIQYIYKDPVLGLSRAAQFLTDAPFVLDRWLMERGFTIGIQDCFTSPEIIKEREANIAKIKMLTKQIGGEIIGDPIELERREDEVKMMVTEIKNRTAKFLEENIPIDNNFKVMVSSKSKGSITNYVQAAGTMGQQTAWGERLPLALEDTNRCMPHFMPGDTDIEARGFCHHSLSEGLDNVEWVMHSYASREGLINTAVSLSDVGDIHRHMSKCLEDLVVRQDGSVRNASDMILQYVYGDDGFVGGQLQKLIIPGRDVNVTFFIDIQNSVSELNAKYGFY